MEKALDHLYIVSTVAFTVYSQLIMRWQVSLAGGLPTDTSGKVMFVGALLLKPWVITGMAASFFAGVSWMLAMTKFEVSYAFPFVSVTYVLILISSAVLFNETMNSPKIVGTLIIMVGLVVLARG